MRALLLCALLAAGCDDRLLALGEACSTSTECQPTLLCDTALDPPTCQRSSSPRPDLSAEAGDLRQTD